MRVSAVVATYNGARFVEEQLRSILTQTRPVDEVVVTDDGSSDGTLDIVRRVLDGAGPDVVVLADNPRPGVTGNFEHGIRAASGDVVLLSDQDDRWMPDRVTVSVAAFEGAPAAAVLHADAILIDSEGEETGWRLFDALGVTLADRERIRSGDALPVFIRRNVATGATMAIRPDRMADAMPFPDGWVHDEWLATWAAASGRLTVCDAAVIEYRQHGGNEIGVSAPTFRRKVSRMLAPRVVLLADLARRSAVLAERSRVAGLIPAAAKELIERKAAFDERRTRYPRTAASRLGAILANASGYPELSSQGRLDIIRDLIRPV